MWVNKSFKRFFFLSRLLFSSLFKILSLALLSTLKTPKPVEIEIIKLIESLQKEVKNIKQTQLNSSLLLIGTRAFISKVVNYNYISSNKVWLHFNS